MIWSRTLSAIVFVSLLVQPFRPIYADPALPSGAYEVIARLELPHLERWAVDHVATVCIPSSRRNGEILVPVLSANNPFAQCTAENMVGDDARLQYDIVCPGRGAAKAHATYSVSSETFSGNVAMVMGAKNMTMTEVQTARRIGDCNPSPLEAATGSDADFLSRR
jgi:Protein of unknown function (DUF3617)